MKNFTLIPVVGVFCACLSLSFCRASCAQADPVVHDPRWLSPDVDAKKSFALTVQADKAFNRGDLDEAEKLYKEAIPLYRLNNFARMGLTRIAERRGDVATTIAGYRAVIYPQHGSYSTDGDDPAIRMKYVLLLLKPENGGATHNWREAVTLYEPTVRTIARPRSIEPQITENFDPGVPEPKAMQAMAHTILGIAAARTGKYADAVVEYDAALQLEPKLAVTHCYKAMALNGIGKRHDDFSFR